MYAKLKPKNNVLAQYLPAVQAIMASGRSASVKGLAGFDQASPCVCVCVIRALPLTTSSASYPPCAHMHTQARAAHSTDTPRLLMPLPLLQAVAAAASDPLFRRAQDHYSDVLYYQPSQLLAETLGMR